MANATTQHSPSQSSAVSEIRPKLEPLPPLPKHITTSRPCLCPKCKPDLYQLARHPQDIEHSNSRRPPILKIWQHDAYYLATLAANSFKDLHTDMQGANFSQHLARNKWNEIWLVSYEYQLLASTPDLSILPIQRVLKNPAEIFNSLFFLNQIPIPVIRIKWGCGETPAQQKTNALQGHTQHHEYVTVIELNPYHKRHLHNPTGVLRTLLHEMVHAFLGRYACFHASGSNPNEYCNNEACKTLHLETNGRTSHGRAWQYLAKCIEDVGEKFLPGLSIWLGRQEVLREEIQVRGWRPSECDFKPGGLLEKGFDEALVRVAMLGPRRARDDDVVMEGFLREYKAMVRGEGRGVLPVRDGEGEEVKGDEVQYTVIERVDSGVEG